MKKEKNELELTKQQLKETQEALNQTKAALNQARQKCAIWERKAEEETDISDHCLRTMRDLLKKWTGEESLDVKTNKMLEFNTTDRQVEMIGALMDYLHTGDRYLFDHEVQRTMFKVMCQRFDKKKIVKQ
ncbi:hypothetical protein SAMN04487851_102105 [Prevotella sp. tc2-28]|uniref:hypothetical protein n=1 Tax=Prevotella sp. tc2-28 TaxID=1761888 RepID=UPI0008990A50|nr:hypothetical protein [Prevotella sp. tc2-28]SEA04351.1 hypothetical protein SAMN04487851_102105 [Prevotella sp. tc2-28]